MRLIYFVLITCLLSLSSCAELMEVSQAIEQHERRASENKKSVNTAKADSISLKYSHKNNKWDYVVVPDSISKNSSDNIADTQQVLLFSCNLDSLFPIAYMYQKFDSSRYEQFLNDYNNNKLKKAKNSTITKYDSHQCWFYRAMTYYKMYNDPRYIVASKLEEREWKYTSMTYVEYRDLFWKEAERWQVSCQNNINRRAYFDGENHIIDFLNCIEEHELPEDYFINISNEAEFKTLKLEQEKWLASDSVMASKTIFIEEEQVKQELEAKKNAPIPNHYKADQKKKNVEGIKQLLLAGGLIVVGLVVFVGGMVWISSNASK